ncbi:MAG: rod shape-determining protein MreC [Clostridia bacterium]|nr:rod shape-determining protein MreC [Clostridia bacterium]
MKRLFGNKIFMVVAILVILFVGASALFAVFGPEGSSLHRVAASVVSPFQNLFTAGAERVSRLTAAVTKYEELEAENEALKAQIRDMEAIIRDADSYRIENEQLKALLGMEEANPEMDLVSALVIAWNDEQWSSVFTVNKGTADGIEVGDAVIVDAGLVGVVTAVSRGSAEVSTLIDTSVSLHMSIYQSDLEVIGGGEFSLMKKNKLRLSNIPLGGNVKMGDTVMTEEYGEVPGGILVGTVSAIDTEGHGMASYATVTPSASLNGLDQVFIVTDFARDVAEED